SLGLMEESGDLRNQAWALHHLSDTWRLEDLPREVDLLGQAHDIFVGLGDRAGQLLMAQEMAYLLTTNGGVEFQERYEEARRLAPHSGWASPRRAGVTFALRCASSGPGRRPPRWATPTWSRRCCVWSEGSGSGPSNPPGDWRPGGGGEGGSSISPWGRSSWD